MKTDADLEWRWRAQRIARTETTAALNAGTLQAAVLASELAGGKAWLSERDHGVRHHHRIADGQIVRLCERFTVGPVARLLHLRDPAEPPESVINCRCSLHILIAEQVQAELQGQEGGHGVAGGFARLGPDDPAAYAGEP